MLVYIDNCTISVALKKRDVATLKPRAVINMIMPMGIIMLMTGNPNNSVVILLFATL
jgi:hypothetical protein